MSKWSCVVTGVVVFALLALVLPSAALADGKEEKVPVQDLPKAVVDAVMKLCPGGQIISAEKETEDEDGEVEIEYEIEVKMKGGNVVEVEVEMTADGQVKKAKIEADDDEDDDDEDDD